MYKRQVGNLPPCDNFFMLTKSDAAYAASYLAENEPQYHYEAKRHFLGYEGYDGGIVIYEKEPFADTYIRGACLGWVKRDRAEEICKDRPMVAQADSWK